MGVKFKKFSIQRVEYKRGFTLVELMTVMVIILILAGLLITAAQSAKKQAKIAKAKSMVAALEMAIGMYNKDTGLFPECGSSPYQQGTGCLLVTRLTTGGIPPPLGWSGPYIHFNSNDITGGVSVKDPWGNKYYYRAMGVNHGGGANHTNWVDIWSAGPNGTSGNSDDITNW